MENVLIALISGLSVSIPTLVVAWWQRKPIREVQRQTAPISNGDADADPRTLAQQVHDLHEDLVAFMDMFGNHVADKHGGDPFPHRRWSDRP